MKLLMLSMLLLAVLLSGCGASEEPADTTETSEVAEVTETEVVEEEVVEVVEEAPAVVLLPEPWPQDFVLPANLVVVEQSEDENGNSVIVANFPDGVERPSISEFYHYLSDGVELENWSILEVEGFNSYASDMDFHVPLTSEAGIITCDGFWGAGNLLSVTLVWERP